MSSKLLSVLSLFLFFGGTVISNGTKDAPAILTHEKNGEPREALLMEIEESGAIITDNGTKLETPEEFDKFMRVMNWSDYSPRLILKSDVTSTKYYHIATSVLLAFEKFCPSYSLVIEHPTKATLH